ncbi:MAG: hypothetical protein LBQ54_11215 [Planctomycetaceae bacterium]|nr:hypothetical protein [Planctomycetaceae bacterium]
MPPDISSVFAGKMIHRKPTAKLGGKPPAAASRPAGGKSILFHACILCAAY